MREIKFRAWIYIEDKMQYESLFGAEKFGGRDCEIMQFTGLLDKHGKEIYEGDIMETESGTCVVKWYDKGACFRWMFVGDSESPLNYDYREIIGNIYENPELLTPSLKENN